MYTDFLYEALSLGCQSTLSPFAYCVVLLTIWSRCTVHRRRAFEKTTSLNNSSEFWSQHDWLYGVLEKGRRQFTHTLPTDPSLTDPMLIFAHLVADAIIISLHDTLRGKTSPTLQHQIMVVGYEEHAARAAGEMVVLATASARLSCFKASSPLN